MSDQQPSPPSTFAPAWTDVVLDPALEYSVVVPVFNEGANIAALCRGAREQLQGSYELLICYDFEEDNTLPALAAVPEHQKPANLRLVRNRLGRGVR
jgi:dolichol-phosphate mannosyltransferase